MLILATPKNRALIWIITSGRRRAFLDPRQS
jgi:hypothetical protein